MPLINSISRSFPASLLFNNVEVPKNLEPVTRRGTETRDSSQSGISDASVNRIWQAAENFYRTGAHPALMICLRRRGKIILNRSIGFAQGGVGEPESLVANPDTPVCLFSASKAIAALLVHKLVELGKIDLDAPVASYIPEFGLHGKDRVTVDDLLRHRAGVPHIGLEKIESLVDHDLIMESLCNRKPHPLLKDRQAYHAISGGHIIAEIVKRVTGESFETIHDRYIRQPLGMKFFTYGLDHHHEPIVAHNAVSGMKVLFPLTIYWKNALGFSMTEVVDASNDRRFREATVPAGNMYATAEECCRFYQMVLDGGIYKGVQVFKPETIRRALKAPKSPVMDFSMLLPVRFSSGLMMGGLPMNLYGAGARDAYGHLGMLNILTWANPELELSGAILTTGKQFLGPHLVKLYGLTGTINRECRAVSKPALLPVAESFA